jgi:hypothetical protein
MFKVKDEIILIADREGFVIGEEFIVMSLDDDGMYISLPNDINNKTKYEFVYKEEVNELFTHKSDKYAIKLMEILNLIEEYNVLIKDKFKNEDYIFGDEDCLELRSKELKNVWEDSYY